jgi:DNA-binding MarR family transcriptional regulator
MSDLAETLLRVVRYGDNASARLTVRQLYIVVACAEQGPQAPVHLAAVMDINPSVISRAVDKLVATGWLRRVMGHPSDGSAHGTLVELTTAGFAYLAGMGLLPGS